MHPFILLNYRCSAPGCLRATSSVCRGQVHSDNSAGRSFNSGRTVLNRFEASGESILLSAVFNSVINGIESRIKTLKILCWQVWVYMCTSCLSSTDTNGD